MHAARLVNLHVLDPMTTAEYSRIRRGGREHSRSSVVKKQPLVREQSTVSLLFGEKCL